MLREAPLGEERHAPKAMVEELDEITLARAKRGDAEARAVLVRRHQRAVFALCARILVSRRALVEDVAQDAFVKVLEALPRFETGGRAKLSTWILTIAARTAIDAVRRSRRAPAALAEEERGSGGGERVLEQRDLGRRVESAMAELPEDQRAVLVLRAYHDLDYPEIADALGIEEGTVKSRLSRARAALRAALEARGVEP